MCTNKPISLIIVDDHSIVVEGIKTMLHGDLEINILETFSLGSSLMNFLNRTNTDIILLDISLPDISGIDLCKKVKLMSPKTKVLALSNHTERSIILQMIQNGANGYLLKNIGSMELKDCIHAAMNGEIVFSREVSSIMANPNMEELKELPRLTKREKEILELISKGLTTQEIADKLFVSPLTIETHRRNLMSKFKVRNAAELIMEASKSKLI
ncbi:MAG: response regulator transcription factor [Bacteroidota bacterium]|nr:response regulator transcription factor [Bacteroidota bacterium]